MEGHTDSAWNSDRDSAKDGTTAGETEPRSDETPAPWDQHRPDPPDITYAPVDTTSSSGKDPTGKGAPSPPGASSQRPPQRPRDSDSDSNEEEDDGDTDSILDLVNPSQAVYRPHGSGLGELGDLGGAVGDGTGNEPSLRKAADVAAKKAGAASSYDDRDFGYDDAKAGAEADDKADEELDLYTAGPRAAGGKEGLGGGFGRGGRVEEVGGAGRRPAHFLRSGGAP